MTKINSVFGNRFFVIKKKEIQNSIICPLKYCIIFSSEFDLNSPIWSKQKSKLIFLMHFYLSTEKQRRSIPGRTMAAGTFLIRGLRIGDLSNNPIDPYCVIGFDSISNEHIHPMHTHIHSHRQSVNTIKRKIILTKQKPSKTTQQFCTPRIIHTQTHGERETAHTIWKSKTKDRLHRGFFNTIPIVPIDSEASTG